MYILRNCKLIPELTEGFDGTAADILIDGEKICSISPPGTDFGLCDGEYDLQGKTLMPGMYDLHTHVANSGFGDMVDGARDEYKTILDTVHNVQASLCAGFTTLRDSGSEPFVCARVRDAIDEGRIIGPNLTCPGRLMSPTEINNNYTSYSERTIHEVDTLDSIRKGVRDEIRDGADYIKYVASGVVSLENSNPFIPIAHFEEVKAIVEEAAFKGRYVGAHVHGAESVKQCIWAGVKTLEHCSEIDDECLELLKEGNSYMIATLAVYGTLLDGAEMPDFIKHLGNESAMRVCKCALEGLKKAEAAGLVVGFGTDMGMINMPHGKNARGLVDYVKLGGITPVQALRHATVHSAEIMGEKDVRGTVKVGKIADLIVINGDPTQEIERMLDSVVMVMKSGSIVWDCR